MPCYQRLFCSERFLVAGNVGHRHARARLDFCEAYQHSGIIPTHRSVAKDERRNGAPFKPMTWLLLSALFAAATAILAKLGVKGVDANVATAVRTSVVVVFTWLLAYVTRQPTSFQPFSRRTWLFLGLSGLATGLSWLCYFHARSEE